MTYALGSDDLEIKRLDMQASWLDQASRLLLQLAGVRPGMRVLDLGTGLGHVAFMLADTVGPTGKVVGVDSADRLLAVATQRATNRPTLRFAKADVRTFISDEPFDAIVGRLILFHLPDPAAVVRHHLAHLRPGGLFIGLDYDIGACRSEPPAPLWELNVRRMVAAFRSAGAHPMIGTQLARMLAQAGLVETRSVGVQDYLAPDDPLGPAMLAGVMRSLSAQIEAAGIASASDLAVDTLQQRLADDVLATRSTLLPPALVGAWGRRA